MTLDKLRVRSPGLRLAAALLFAVAGFGLTGCEGDTLSSSTTGGQTTGVRDASGDLTGGVKDNNGNPIAGAQVFVAGFTATTDAGGQWRINRVPVVNVENNNDTDDANSGRPLTVTIVAAGHLGANITVNPEAIITSSQTGDDDQDADGSQSNPQSVWFDGFLASTGDVLLPRLNATVRGRLRDTLTGTPLAGVVLFMDFNRFLDDQPEGDEDGEATIVTYAAGTSNITATSGADGRFTFSNLPADSCLRLYADGYNLTTDGGDFGGAICNDGDQEASINDLDIGTNDEAIVNLNMVFATISPDEDEICPVVSSVVTVLDQDDDPGQLESGFTDTLVINFSEAVDIDLDALDPTDLAGPGTDPAGASNPITVITGTFPNFEAAAIEDVTVIDANTIQIVLVDPVAAGENVDVRLPREGIEDVDGNNLCVCDNDAGDIGTSPDDEPLTDEICVGFDSLVGNNVELDLEVFTPGSTDTGDLTIVQVTEPTNDGTLLYSFSSSFVDVLSAIAEGVDESVNGDDIGDFFIVGTINQLNQDVPGIEQTLQDLGNARLGCDPEDGPQDCLFVDVNSVRVRITTATDAATYAVAVLDADTGLPLDVEVFPVPPATAVGEADDPANLSKKLVPTKQTITNGGEDWYIVAAGPGQTEFELFIVGEDADIVPGDVVEVIALADSNGDGLGDVLGQFDTVTLVDHVAPTTALQDSYSELIEYPAGVEDALPNLSGCFNQASTDGDPEDLSQVFDITAGGNVVGFTGELPEHAGLTEVTGGDIGDGGEVSGEGDEDASGDRCIGITPFLLIDLTDADADAAHDELTDENPADFDATAASIADAADEAYDETAFAAWDRPAIRMGVSFTENLDEGQVVPFTFSGAGGQFSAAVVQNDTAFTHLPLSGNTQLVDDLVTLLVADALDLANDDHFEVLSFTGIEDTNGVAADAATNADVVIRDQWPPYVVDAERVGDDAGDLEDEAGADDGDLVIQFNEPVIIEVGDRLDFSDGAVQVTFTFTAVNFSQSADGTIIVIDGADLPAIPFGNPDLVFDGDIDDADHVLMDWRSISDERGNAWENFEIFDDGDADEFDDDVVEFLVEDLIGPFLIEIGVETVVGGAGDFIFQLVGTQPVCNWFTDTITPACAADPGFLGEIFSDASLLANCIGTPGVTAVTCDSAFVDDVITTGTCAVAVGSTATLSADTTTLTFAVDCGATTLTAGDVVGFDPASLSIVQSVGQSALDPSLYDSAADTTTAE